MGRGGGIAGGKYTPSIGYRIFATTSNRATPFNPSISFPPGRDSLSNR